MDLGIFLSNKKKLVAWIVGPILFLSALYLALFIYLRSANNAISEKKFMLESMPAIIEKITMAQAMVKSYQSSSSKTEVIEWINSQMNQIAAGSGFIIDSLEVRKDDAKSSDALAVYTISLKGKGELSKIIAFFTKSQSVMPLLTLNDAQLRTTGYTTENIYDAQISFAYNCLT
jgi:hypothetical protein